MRIALLKARRVGALGLDMITLAEPLGLLCVAGALEEAGHECLLVDFRLHRGEEAMERVRRFRPALTGIQCNFTTERNAVRDLARRMKAEAPGTVLAVGGHDASRSPGWFDDAAVDAVVVGDGEETMPALAAALERGAALEEVPGLVLRSAAGQRSTGAAPHRSSLDDLPLPARHLVREYAPHYYINYRKPMALLETTRGCPFRCKFCSVWKFHEGAFRAKSPALVMRELEAIEAPNVFITDDVFWMNPRRDEELARRILASGIRKHFTVQTRTDIVCRHPELVALWRECGRLSVFLGMEALSDEELLSLNKRNQAAANMRALEILRGLDVGYTPNLIVDPAWGREDFARLRRWVEETGTYNTGFSVLTPLPGTDLWDESKDRITTSRWELYDLLHAVLPTALPLEEFYEEYASLWRTTMAVRRRERGRIRGYLTLWAALLTGKVTLEVIRGGMNLAGVLSDPRSYLRGHEEEAAASPSRA